MIGRARNAQVGLTGVNDERELPWLVDEKRFVRDAVEVEQGFVDEAIDAGESPKHVWAVVWRTLDLPVAQK